MFNLKEYREPTHRLPDYLPWAAIVAPGDVLQKDGLLQKTIAFRGADLASSSKTELVSAVARLNNALRRLGSGWAFFIEAQRFEFSRYPSSTWNNPAAWLLDIERKYQFEQAGAHFESSYFITFVWKMPGGRNTTAAAWFYDDPDKGGPEVENGRDYHYFKKTVGEVIDIMRGVFVEVGELDDDQTLGYLHSTISTHRHPVKAPKIPMYLDALLPDQAFTPGDVPMLGESFIPACSFVGFPSNSIPGILDDLNHLRIEYRWVTRFICLDAQDAKAEIEKYRKRWWQKRKNLWTLLKEEASKQESALVNSDAANKAVDADAALQELGEKLVSFGYMTCTVCVWHKDIGEALKRMELVKSVIQSNGFTVRDETLNSKEAWLGSLPGHVYANVRRPLVNTLNLAHVMPLSAIWAGEHENRFLGKISGCSSPHLSCSTTGDTPFWLNLNVDDVGHTLIVGPTGSGKSTLLCMLALQWLKYPNAQVVIFDKDRSARSATLAVNGYLYEPGNEDAPISFQPLAEIDKKAEHAWASGFIIDLLKAQKIDETPSLKKEVDEALANLSSDTVESRTLSVFSALVQSREIRDAIRPYTVAGNFGQLFDGSRDDLKRGPWQMIEMGHLMEMGEDAVVPALSYLFHRVEQRFDGRPTLLSLDESWLFLSHPVFAKRLQKWLKTLRKKNVFVVFATQEVADAADSPIMSTILSACGTKIYLPDEESLTPAMHRIYSNFGLSDTEISLLATAQKKRDYYYRSARGRRMFNLDMGQIALTFAGMSSEADHRFMDKMVSEKKPDEYVPALLKYKGLNWAESLFEASKQNLESGEKLIS